jgi:hypothetical protein
MNKIVTSSESPDGEPHLDLPTWCLEREQREIGCVWYRMVLTALVVWGFEVAVVGWVEFVMTGIVFVLSFEWLSVLEAGTVGLQARATVRLSAL